MTLFWIVVNCVSQRTPATTVGKTLCLEWFIHGWQLGQVAYGVPSITPAGKDIMADEFVMSESLWQRIREN